MTDKGVTAGPPGSRSLACERCGASFACSGDGECWCAAEPHRLPLPAGAGDCLCPQCLRSEAGQAPQAAPLP